MTICTRFEEMVSRFPNKLAVSDDRVELSYTELDGLSRSVAERLTDRDGPGRRYFVAMPRCTEAVVAMLGILRSGGCYVPVDPAMPRIRAEMLSHEVGAAGIFEATPTSFPSDLPRYKAIATNDPAGGRLADRSPDTEAYIIFTSGSTGTPKGVIVPDKAILRLVIDPDYVSLAPSEILFHYASLSFDAATFEVWGALLNGARLAILTETRASARTLGHFLEKHEISTAWLTSGLFNAVLDSSPQILSGLRQLLTGGEALSVPHVAHALGKLPKTRLINGYGPTENTTFTCCYPIPQDPAQVANWSSIPIGRAIRGTTTAIVDSSMAPVEPGVVGELITGGEGLAIGYLGDDKLTKERFIHSPDLGGGRWYRTGDLVREQPSGLLEFVGRLDHQLKINGFRIEPGELAHALRQLPGIRDSAARGHETAAGHQRLVGYVIADNPEAVEEATVLERLRKLVPDYMVPSRVLSLSSLPLNTNGKLDLHALPNPFQEHYDQTISAASLKGPLAEILSELFELKSIPAELSFTQLGGDSLAAVRVSARLEERFGIVLPTYRMLEPKPLGELDTGSFEKRVNAAAEKEENNFETFPLSTLQRQVWYLSRQAPESLSYHVTCRMEFGAQVDSERLRESLGRVFQSQPLLHASLEEGADGSPVWRSRPDTPLPLETIDLPALKTTEFRQMVDSAIDAKIRQPMPLHGQPLVQWYRWRSEHNGEIWLQLEHHLIHDGWSLRLLLERWARAYEKDAKQEIPAGCHYGCFATLPVQQEPLPPDHPAISFWRSRLDKQPPLFLTPSSPEAVRSEAGTVFRQQIPVELVDQVHRLASKEGVTPFVCYLTTFLVTLCEAERIDGGVIGIGVANRTLERFEETIGMFVNMVPLATNLSNGDETRAGFSPGNLNWKECRSRIGKNLREALSYQEIPFSEVVRGINPSRNPGTNPLFEVLFSMHQRPDLRESFGGQLLSMEEALDNGAAKFDLNAFVVAEPASTGPGRAWLRWEYRRERFEHRQMERLFSRFFTLLKVSVESPREPVPLQAPTENRNRVAMQASPRYPDIEIDQDLYIRVERIWSRFFPGESLTPESNFFQLGGHSLMTIELTAHLEKELLTEISLTTIFEAPTLGEFVTRLSEHDQSAAFRVTRLNSAEGIPLVLTHGWGGDPLVFRPLVHDVEDAFPLACLHADPRRAVAFKDLSSLCHLYAEKLQEVLPNQPFILAGYSLGGIIAWATALSLCDLGAQVRGLIVIDAIPPELPPRLRLWTRRRLLWRQMRHHARTLFTLRVNQWSPYIKRRATALRLHALGHARIRPPQPDEELPESFNSDADPYQRLTERWKPGKVPVDLKVIWSPREGIDVPACWRPWATRGLAEHQIDGAHLQLLEGANSKAIANLLKETYWEWIGEESRR